MKSYIMLALLFSVTITYAQRNFYNVWLNTQITIKDGEYYKRLDEIRRAEVEKEIEKAAKAYKYLDEKDYESAHYWAALINYDVLEELKCERSFLLCISNYYMGKKAYKRYYGYLKRCEPIKRRAAEEIINSGKTKEE